jgi:hypothetical protein
MAIFFPDGARIAQIGTIDVQQQMSSSKDKLEEYALVVPIDRGAFFKDLTYTWDGSGFALGPAASAAALLNAPAIKAAFQARDDVHFQPGSKFDLMRHAFPLRFAGPTLRNGDLPPEERWALAYRNLQGEASLAFYAVFLDQWGQAVPHWEEAPDGAVRVFYEHFGIGADPLATSQEAADILPTLLGLTGSGVHGGFGVGDPAAPATLVNVVSGPGAVATDVDPSTGEAATDVCFENLLMLNGATVRVKGVAAMPLGGADGEPYYYSGVRWGGAVVTVTASGAAAATGGSAELRDLRLVRASDAGLQTLVFAIARDGATGRMGLADVLPVMRRFPPGVTGGAECAVYGCPPAAAEGAAADAAADAAARVTFADPDFRFAPADADAGAVYVVRAPAAQGPPADAADAADPMGRARPMFLPPVAVSTSAAVSDAALAQTRLSVLSAHKAMPHASLGERLLQLYSLVSQSSAMNDAVAIAPEALLSPSTKKLLDVRAGLAKRLDIAREPDRTHDVLVQSLASFFAQGDNCAKFLRDFEAKFPGVLSAAALEVGGGPVTINKALTTSGARDFAMVVYVNLNYTVLELGASGTTTTAAPASGGVWMRNIPLVVQLLASP